MYQKILIRFGEISLKGKNKMDFVKILARNIEKKLKLNRNEIETSIDRIFIPYSLDNLEQLNYVFGISSFSPVIVAPSKLNEIENKISNIDLSRFQTFKINARRQWKEFEMDSLTLNQHFGGFVLKNNQIKVDVKNPNIEINLEVHKEQTYIFWEKYKGLGGLPIGSSGKAIHLLSGGIDSPVAALEMMKRGVKLIFLSFITPPHTDEKTVEKLMMIVEQLTKYQLESKLILFNYTKIMNYLSLTSNQAYKIILMRRSFYRIASKIANKNKCLAISNGENLGQVASQTMEAINVIHNQSQFPVYQPLLTNDKLETIEKSQKFQLFEISIIKACETCELFAPNHPSTKPTLEQSQKLEQELDELAKYEDDSITNNIEIKKFEW